MRAPGMVASGVQRDLHYSPFLPEVMEDPFPFYRRLRDEQPVYYMPTYNAWVLSRFDDIWTATEQPEIFTTIHGTTAAQAVSKVEPPVPSLNQIDPPEHTHLRKTLRDFFSRASALALEPMIRADVRERLERHAEAGEIDAVRGLADPVAARVACRILSLPDEAGPLLVAWVHRYAANDPSDEGRSSDALQSAIEMNQYLAERVAERRRGVGEEGIIDVFLTHEIHGRRLEDLEIASHLQTLVIGGTDTTPKVIASALWHLERESDQRRRIAEDPRLAAPAFAEALRLEMPTQFMARTVAKETVLHGETLRPGQGVLLLYASANRDEREFAAPDRYDSTRRARRHLGFGHAAHVCIGAHVARLEGRIVLEEVLARFPRYGIDAERIGFRSADQLRGMTSLPLILS
ncbi:MAG: cytochrome P450 [Deltaproteobacteria bacterium]|nr:cytochrome P450 [Deltaproteobacteria bacterium]